MWPIQPHTPAPETSATGLRRSTLLLAAMRAFLELERERAATTDEEMLLAEYSELVVVPVP